MRTIEELYPLVSEAIFREQASPSSRASPKVSRLEEEIARLLPATSDEGRIARRGAVFAALKAGKLHRARALAMQYVEAPVGLDMMGMLRKATGLRKMNRWFRRRAARWGRDAGAGASVKTLSDRVCFNNKKGRSAAKRCSLFAVLETKTTARRIRLSLADTTVVMFRRHRDQAGGLRAMRTPATVRLITGLDVEP